MTNLKLISDSPVTSTYDLVEQYRKLDRQIKALDKEKDAIGKALKSGYFLNNNDFIHNDQLLATYRPQIRITLDQKSLEKDQPVIYNDYLVASEVRVFLLK